MRRQPSIVDVGKLHIERLMELHSRASFLCEREPEIETFFRKQVADEIDNAGCQCFILTDDSSGNEAIGFYTLSAAVVRLNELQDTEKPSLPYSIFPALLLGRMGIDDRYRGRNYGATLLLHAYATAIGALSTIGHVGIIVDPKNDALVKWYAQHGFERLTRKDRRMFIPVNRMREICAIG